MINYIIIAGILFLLEVVYIKIAIKKDIKDNPNHRSAHTKPTVRGGGIIVPLALLTYMFFYKPSNPQFYYFIGGTFLVAIISFIDDLITLSSKLRILIHFVAIITMLYGLNLIEFSSVYSCIIILILLVFSMGFLNIYNFMDGINGITFLNAFVSYLALFYINKTYIEFTSNDLLIVLLISIIVFGFFNFRKKAICFAGDIGSITIGFSLLYFVIKLYLQTNNLAVFLILSVYLIDGGWTIVERFLRKENIFEAHKRHLYQLLANDLKVSHLRVSTLIDGVISLITVFLFLSFTYYIIKTKALKRIKWLKK